MSAFEDNLNDVNLMKVKKNQPKNDFIDKFIVMEMMLSWPAKLTLSQKLSSSVSP